MTTSWTDPWRWIFVLVVGATVALALWLAQDRAPPADPLRVLLDAQATLREDGTEFTFVVRAPSRVEVRLTPSGSGTGTAEMGHAASATKGDPYYAPDPETARSFSVGGDAAPFAEVIRSVGLYVVRVQGAGAPGESIRCLVTAVPLR